MSKRFSNCILHIGTEKTGTTSIQTSFFQNRGLLRGEGYFYPVSLGRANHTALVVYARDDDTSDHQRKRALYRLTGGLTQYRQELPRKLEAEIQDVECDTLLLSNEHLHSRLTNVTEKRRLKTFLDQFCDSYRIIVYLRRQDRVAVSHYSTRLKTGRAGFGRVLPLVGKRLPYYYDYACMLEQFGEVFGRDSITVRVFQKDHLEGGDVVRDIYRVIGFERLDELSQVTRQNESVHFDAQRFLASFNKRVPPFINDRPNPLRDGVDAIVSGMTGPGRTVSQSQAAEFLQAFAPGNRWIAETFLGDSREELFDPDLSMYPERPKQGHSPDGLIETGVTFYLAAKQEAVELRAELLCRDAQAALADGRRTEAERALRRALEWCPEHAAAKSALAAIHETTDDSDDED